MISILFDSTFLVLNQLVDRYTYITLKVYMKNKKHGCLIQGHPKMNPNNRIEPARSENLNTKKAHYYSKVNYSVFAPCEAVFAWPICSLKMVTCDTHERFKPLVDTGTVYGTTQLRLTTEVEVKIKLDRAKTNK